MNKISKHRCPIFISLYVRYYLNIQIFLSNIEMIHKCLCVYCLLLHYKFQSAPSGRPLDLPAQNIDPTNRNLLCPFIIAVDIYPQHVSISILHVIVQYRAEEQRSPITIVIVPASGEAISAVTVRRKEGGKTAGISLSLVIAFHI